MGQKGHVQNTKCQDPCLLSLRSCSIRSRPSSSGVTTASVSKLRMGNTAVASAGFPARQVDSAVLVPLEAAKCRRHPKRGGRGGGFGKGGFWEGGGGLRRACLCRFSPELKIDWTKLANVMANLADENTTKSVLKTKTTGSGTC